MSFERTVRRCLVVTNYLVIAALVVNYGLIERGVGLRWLYNTAFPIILLILISRTPLMIFVFEATGLFSRKLDERQQTQRNRIYALSYQTLIVLASICLIGWMFFSKYPVAWFMPQINRPPWAGYADEMACFLLFSVDTVLFLPVALVAWLEPDPLPNESEPLTLTHPTLKS